MRFKKAVGALVVGLVVLVFANIALAGFGISPPFVRNDHLIKGSHFEQKIILSRSEPTEDLQAKLEIDAPQIQDWISIEIAPDVAIKNSPVYMILPKGQEQVAMTVLIDVPEDAELGDYGGKIRVSTVPPKEGMITIALGGQITIDLTVAKEEIFDFKVKSMDIPDSAEGDPIKVFLDIINTGNIAGAPSKVHLDVYNIGYNKILESKDVFGLEKVSPFSTESIIAVFLTNLGIGQYWGEVSVFKNEEMVRKMKTPFNIVEKKVVPEKEFWEKFWEKFRKGFPDPYLYAGLGILILVGLGWWHWKRKKKRR